MTAKDHTPNDSAPDVKIELQYFEGCPGYKGTLSIIKQVSDDLGIHPVIEETVISADAQAMEIGFRGSPTVLVNGRDTQGLTEGMGAMGCRIYFGKPVPPRWLIEAALLRELAPRGWLFMCVHNSARSQLAEAIARHLAPEGVAVMSAGSEPSRVHPMVPRVLEEAGIPYTGLYSKGTESIDPRDVQATVTLCAEEVCPVFLAQAWHVHWPLSDPAAQTDPEAGLKAFRHTRDVLISRLTVLMDYTV